MGKNRDGTMTVLEHLSELRQRLVWPVCFSGKFICFFQGGSNRKYSQTGRGIGFVFISPQAFGANLRLSVIAGVVQPSNYTIRVSILLPALYVGKTILGAVAGACLFFVQVACLAIMCLSLLFGIFF